MSLTVSIRFLTGRAHLHPWQAHHSDGKVDWPPSPWRLLRALVAVAGRGLTALPDPDYIVSPGTKPRSTKKNPSLVWPPEGYVPLPDNWYSSDEPADEIPISRLAALLATLAPLPDIWLPKTSGGHTRQFFPIHEGGVVKPSGSAVFDTFAVIHKDQPILFHWSNVEFGPEDQRQKDLRLILQRMTYFGRAESWCQAEVVTNSPEVNGIQREKTHWVCVCIDDGGKPKGQEHRDYTLERKLAACPLQIRGRTESPALSNEALALFTQLNQPKKLEAKKNLSECSVLAGLRRERWINRLEVPDAKDGLQLVARGDWTDTEIDECVSDIEGDKGRKLVRELIEKCRAPKIAWEERMQLFGKSSTDTLLLRCLLRESGQDMKDGLERPIGSRWVQYAVPRAIYDLPRPKIVRPKRREETVHVVRYALNTASVHRSVLPPATDTLLVADKFRSAILALHDSPSRNLSGHEADGKSCADHDHAFYWPTDENNDGFIDHVTVYCPRGFEISESDALRRLGRIRQRGGRPDLLVTPIYIGDVQTFSPWSSKDDSGHGHQTRVFVSATPYFCPIHLSHGRGRSGRVRSVTEEVLKGMRIQGIVVEDTDVRTIQEIVFDYAPEELVQAKAAISAQGLAEPVPPRQFFPAIAAPAEYPPLPDARLLHDRGFRGAWLKDPDAGFPFGLSMGLFVNEGTRFIRAMSFCKQRRHRKVKGYGRMFRIEFAKSQEPRPFAIGDQCHFGLGLFTPAPDA